MHKRILALMIAFLLVANLSITAFAEETTEITENSTETTAATDATAVTEAGTEPSAQTETTENQTDPTQATDATEPTQPDEPTTPTAPAGSQIPTSLEIDTENIYDGMDKAYENGYVPKIENGVVYLVLPLLSNGEIHDNEIKVSLGLDSSASSPFVVANYEKTFELEEIKPKNSEEKVELFLVEFDVKLSSFRTISSDKM